jgi:hypothetical protein
MNKQNGLFWRNVNDVGCLNISFDSYSEVDDLNL